VGQRCSFGSVTVWRHSKHIPDASADAQANPTAHDRQSRLSWLRILRAASRSGDASAMARAQSAIDDLDQRITAQPRKGKHGEQPVIRVVYDGGDEIPEHVPQGNGTDLIGAISRIYGIAVPQIEPQLSRDEFLRQYILNCGPERVLQTCLTQIAASLTLTERKKEAAIAFLTAWVAAEHEEQK
jgi:hypothetical protein